MHKLKLLLIPGLLLALASCSIDVAPGTTTPEPSTGVSVITQATQPVADTVPPATLPGISQAQLELIEEWADRIYPGTTIKGIDVSGLTLAQAKAKVEKVVMEPLASRRVRYSYASKKNYMSYKKLEVAIDETIYQKALANGKDGSDEAKLKWIATGKPLELEPVLTFDQDLVASVMDEVQENLTALSHQFAAIRKDGRVLLKDGATEDVLDRDAFMAQISQAINFSSKNNPYIEAPVTTIPVTITQAQLDPINERLTRFSTDYGWSYDARKYNVGLAAEKISGSLIMPGQEFSFNQSIGGGAGSSNGFQDSGVYVGLEMVQEPGGGVCQVSSTLYNVLLNLGIDPTQRKNHGMIVGYLPPGMDAVIYAPYLDLRFKNPFKTPIYLTAKADGEKLTFSVYGNEDAMGGYSYKYENEIYELDAAVIKEIEDKTIPKGAIVLDPTPKDGRKVRVYKITYKDGKRISRKLYTDNTYRRSDGSRRIGTGVGKEINKDWYVDRSVEKYPKGWVEPKGD